MRNVILYLKQNYMLFVALAVLAAIFGGFIALHPRGFTLNVLTIWANQGTGLAFVAISQTFVVLTAGIDLSTGAMMALCNCMASEIVSGTPGQIALGVILVLLAGCGCGLVNGLVVVFGRIQPIIVTLATGAVYTGIALFIRPTTGGHLSEGLSDAMTYDLFSLIPTALLLVFGTLLLVWTPLKRTTLGRGIYAVGSAEGAAYMSGVKVGYSKLIAYTVAGLFAALAGLFVGLQTLSGDAMIGPSYTLNSIAAVVIGGTSLAGGVGGPLGSIVGAFILRTIGGLMFFAGISPMAQDLFAGLVLLAAVSTGVIQLLRIRARLDVLR